VVAHDIAPMLALRAHLLEGLAFGPLVLADLIPGATRQLLPGAGYFAPEDDPTGFAEAIKGFLREAGYW
jgi:pimeloyl-ACP methyl ester carboxylesterase